MNFVISLCEVDRHLIVEFPNVAASVKCHPLHCSAASKRSTASEMHVALLMRFLAAALLLIGAICSLDAASASAAHLPSSAVGITFDTNNIYNWSIWQFDIVTSPPAHKLLANIPGCSSHPLPLPTTAC